MLFTCIGEEQHTTENPEYRTLDAERNIVVAICPECGEEMNFEDE